MPFNLEEFRAYLTIDKTALDDEVVRQPSLFYEVSEAYAEAAAERDALKEQLAVIDAGLDGRIRKANEKGTEALIKSQIQAHKEHKTAFAEWLEAKEYADKLGALKEAFKDRSYMIRELADLHVSNYFETTAMKGTYNTDAVTYKRRRERLAEGREAKK